MVAIIDIHCCCCCYAPCFEGRDEGEIFSDLFGDVEAALVEDNNHDDDDGVRREDDDGLDLEYEMEVLLEEVGIDLLESETGAAAMDVAAGSSTTASAAITTSSSGAASSSSGGALPAGSAAVEPPPLPPPVGPPPQPEATSIVALMPDPAPALAREPAAPAQREFRGRAHHGEPWGVFALIFKMQGAHGGFEATCPFHRGTDTAPRCRQFIPMHGPDDHANCKLRAKVWCLAHQFYGRKRRHLRYQPQLDECPDPAAVEAACIFEPPDAEAILPDAVLDEIEEPDPDSPVRRRG